MISLKIIGMVFLIISTMYLIYEFEVYYLRTFLYWCKVQEEMEDLQEDNYIINTVYLTIIQFCTKDSKRETILNSLNKELEKRNNDISIAEQALDDYYKRGFITLYKIRKVFIK